MQDISVLASDDFEGRAPNSPGEDKTIEYLERRFREIGLEPGGDLNPDGTRKWTQDVPLVQSVIDGPVDIQIAANGQPVCWTQGQEVAIRAARTGGGHIDISHAPMVFLGYGVFAPERNWDDFKGIDLNGKVGIVLVNDPDFETGSGDFEGKAMTYYGRWTYKYEEAARRGALGLLIIHETAPATYGWATVRNSNINAIYDIERPASSTPPVPLEGWIQKDTAVDLLAATGLSFEELKLAAQKRSFQPVELTGVDLSVKYALKRDKVITRNIVGLLPGKSHPDEYVMYTAHWDHLGVGQPDADGDSIYNGAVDNGTGVAVMLDIAQAFASGPRPERSILFASVSVEERGLLGSEYYVANPLYPLETTAAVINMDALGVFGPVKDFSIAGNAYSSLQSDLSSIGAKMGRSFVPDPKPEAGSFFRSDHFPFARVGVPAISFRSGRDLVNGGRGAGDKAWKSYVMERYHQPNDEVDDNWDASGLVADRDLMLALGRHIANSREWPGWDAGSEFKAERDKSDATRK
ncbi:MAG: M28 family metallopeptidase [Sphingobium sp.]